MCVYMRVCMCVCVCVCVCVSERITFIHLLFDFVLVLDVPLLDETNRIKMYTCTAIAFFWVLDDQEVLFAHPVELHE